MSPDITAPTRRRFRWSLRTMFVVVTVFGCWLGYNLNWIRQRRELIAQYTQQRKQLLFEAVSPVEGTCTAPGLLWVFGEPGAKCFSVLVSSSEGFTAEDRAIIAHVRRLFPETDIIPGHTLGSPEPPPHVRRFKTWE